MAEKTQRRMIEEIHTDVIQVKTVLLGIPNTADNGVVGQVKSNTEAIGSNSKAIGKVKIIIASIVGSGALGTGIWQLLT